MSATPPPEERHAADDAPLNPALKQGHDPSYGPDQSGADPMDSVSVKKDEGKAWPMIWAVTTIVCVLIAIALIVL
jgi:hypothetical protein